MIFLYSLAVRLYGLAICTVSLFNPKAAAWCRGRRHYFRRLEEIFSRRGKTVWFHCASLGEFEQGRPVIEALKERDPSLQVVLTFFSPSGYEVRKDYDKADVVCYLPLDTPGNARRFLDIVQPDLAVFVKYEFWFHFLTTLKKRAIPVVLISAIFRPGQWFFRWYGLRFLRVMECFSRIFVQDEASQKILARHGIKTVEVAGDTRFDRVMAIAAARKRIPLAEAFAGDRTVVVAGSTWKEDETLLLSYLNRRVRPYKWIIAPHEIHPSHIAWLTERLQVPFMLFSEVDARDPAKVEVLVIDNIGMLSSLYAYGRLAYIGGGFGSGIHNVPEAAVYGVPVLFGPRYGKFREAVDLVRLGGAYPLENATELERLLNRFYDDVAAREKAGAAARDYVRASAGSTEKIVNNLLTFF